MIYSFCKLGSEHKCQLQVHIDQAISIMQNTSHSVNTPLQFQPCAAVPGAMLWDVMDWRHRHEEI